MSNEDKTDPIGIAAITHDELMARLVSSVDYLIGKVEAIEARLADALPRLINRTEALEKGCKERHSNGNTKKTSSMW